jgi:energy-coupling factor transport system permease protein
MRLLVPIVPDPAAPLARANPLAKLAAAIVLMAALFVSLDGVTAAIILVTLVSLLPLSGVGARAFLAHTWLIGLAAVMVALLNTLLAPQQAGPTLVTVGSLRIGAETALTGLGLGVRLVGIALAGLLATMTTQPIDLADALVQQLHVSPRFAIGTLAAMRLVPLLGREWQTIGMARRARGVAAGSPLGAVRLLGGRLLTLLVGAVRRGSRMAIAMESRGLGARPCRTAARPQRMRLADWGWILSALLLAGGAVGVSLALGSWRFLLGG